MILAAFAATVLLTSPARAETYDYAPTDGGSLCLCLVSTSFEFVLSPAYTTTRGSSASLTNRGIAFATFSVPAGVTYTDAVLSFDMVSSTGSGGISVRRFAGSVAADQPSWDAVSAGWTSSREVAGPGPNAIPSGGLWRWGHLRRIDLNIEYPLSLGFSGLRIQLR
ncbi:MAG: hypothetical protein ACK4FB_01610 [Brevundimonas sp.]|uniref:hypothetical protein n=1 Tax=Brevundimonas sp. TaxID=1871086 RepID=UPI00391D2305